MLVTTKWRKPTEPYRDRVVLNIQTVILKGPKIYVGVEDGVEL